MANTKEATDYEGWTNRATWNVSLWLNNDEGSYRSMIEFAKKYDGKMTAGKARYFGMQTFGDRTPDNCRLGTVNWSEIADMMNEAVAS